jgi:hypothetical protein
MGLEHCPVSTWVRKCIGANLWMKNVSPGVRIVVASNSSMANCPHSEYVNVISAGHMVAGDRNDVFGTSVIDFLKRAVPPGVLPKHSSHARSKPPVEPGGDLNDVP